MRLLFTGGGGAGNEALFRLLGPRHQCHFADADPAAIDPGIPADRRHAIPMAADPGFAAALAGLCRALAIDLLAPGVDEELVHLPEVMRLAPGTLGLCPPADYVDLMLDKLAMARALERASLPAPRTATLDGAADIGFPLLAKPRRGRGSRGVRVLTCPAEAAAYRTLAGVGDGDLLAQELLTGQEYTVMMVADRTRALRAVVPVRVAVKRGITLRAETDAHPAVVGACTAIHAAFPTTGCYNIQLMLESSGRAVPFEINPRLSTTACLGIAAGVDPFALFVGDGADGLAGYQVGLGLSRHWVNHMSSRVPP